MGSHSPFDLAIAVAQTQAGPGICLSLPEEKLSHEWLTEWGSPPHRGRTSYGVLQLLLDKERTLKCLEGILILLVTQDM